MTIAGGVRRPQGWHALRHALNQGLLDDITRLDSPRGLLSVYAGTDPVEPDRVRIELKNECARVEAEHAQDGSAEIRDALESARVGVQEALAGRPQTTNAVAGFIPIGGAGAEPIWVALPEVDPTALVLDAAAYMLPLLPLIERFNDSGVVTVARDEMAVYAWAQGDLEPLERRSVRADTATWRDTDGPFNSVAAGSSFAGDAAAAMSTVGSGDAYADKLERATIAQLARTAAPLIAEHVARRSWRRLVWFGNAAIIDALRASIGDTPIAHIVADDTQVLGASRDELVGRVRDVCDRRWRTQGSATVRALAERPPGDRVESVEEGRALAGQGRVDQLFVMVPDEIAADDDHRRVNALVAEVLLHGGRVRALPGPLTNDPASTTVVATLRW